MRDMVSLTAQTLHTLGIPTPAPLSEATIALWRSSPTAKYHWADQRASCQHLPGDPWARVRERLPVTDRVPALGFEVPESALCSRCAHQIAISSQADAFLAIAAEVARADAWVNAGRAAVASADWSWLQFARWRARQPLQGTRWTDAIKAVRGHHWGDAASALQRAVATHREQADTVTHTLVNSIRDDAGQSALLERAIRMVETDSAATQEAAEILTVSGCTRAPHGVSEWWGGQRHLYKQPSPWPLVADAWRRAKQADITVEPDCIATQLDELFPHVHDLSALECAHDDVPYQRGDCIHTWAERTAQAHRHTRVAEWLNRLDMALAGLTATGPDITGACTHLLCVDAWPLTADGMDDIAYLSQFQVVCGPYDVQPGRYQQHTVAVLRVPEWAAAHASELAPPMRCEPITDEPRQAIALARHSGVELLAEEFTTRRRPSAMVAEAREHLHHQTIPPNSWHPYARPLTPGSAPPEHYGGAEWSMFSARYALSRGATFVYGHDATDLLALALPSDRQSRLWARVHVELQTGCRRPWHEDGPHICEVDGIAESVSKTGSLSFTAEGMRTHVTIPASYIVGLTFTR
jgi:hypothetical protein